MDLLREKERDERTTEAGVDEAARDKERGRERGREREAGRGVAAYASTAPCSGGSLRVC